jgi:predicted metalloprotease with PDZ domain
MVATPEEGRWAITVEWRSLRRSASAAVQRLQLRLNVVKHWVSVHLATGGIRPAHKSGRRRVLARAAADNAHALLLDDSQRSSQMVAIQLQQEGTKPAVNDMKTGTRATKRVGLDLGQAIVACRGKPCKQLTQTNKNARIGFCQNHFKKD